MRHVTAAGRAIEADSFAIIDQQAGPHDYDEKQWVLVRRLIHTSGDLTCNGLIRFHPNALTAGHQALSAAAPILVDVRMIAAGVSSQRLARFGNRLYQFMDDPEVETKARAEGTTKATQSMRRAWELGLLAGAVVGIGNAPTALYELLRLMEHEHARPALIVGMPVGFVAAAESKAALASQETVPWIVIDGTKGGSTLVVAALHALLDTL